MSNLDNKPETEWSSEYLLHIATTPFEMVDRVKEFLSTHPLPQSVLRTFHNMWL